MPSTSHHPDPVHAGGEYLLDGRWRIVPALNRVFDGEVEHQIPDKFMRVLTVLVTTPGVISRQQLFDAVWPDTLVVDESLTRAISSLRKLFDDDPKEPRVIETIPKKGYRLLAPVVRIEPTATAMRTAAPRPARWPLAVLGVAVGLALVVSLAWWVYRTLDDAVPEPPTIVRLTSLPGIEEYPTLSPAGDRLAFVWDGNDEQPDGVFVQVIGAGPPVRLTHVDGHYAFPAWSHDSRFIAFARVAGPTRGLFMVPATGGAEVELLAAGAGEVLQSPTFSPDGRWLGFARQAPGSERLHLMRMDLGTRSVEPFPSPSAQPTVGFRPRFSPDGDRLAFLRIEGERWTIFVTTTDGAGARPVPTGDRPVTDFDWVPDGSGLVVAAGESVRRLDLDGLDERFLATARTTGGLSVAVDEPLIAYSDARWEKNVWQWTPTSNPAGVDAPTRLIHSTGWDGAPALSPDRRWLAFLSDRTGTLQLWIASADGSAPRRLTDLQHILQIPPSWSPDGTRLAFTAEVGGVSRTCVVEIASGRVRMPTPWSGDEVQSGWSGDGTWLYVSRTTPEGREVWRRPATDDGERAAVPITRGGGVRASESPDGTAIFYTRSRRPTDGVWRCGMDGSTPHLVVPLDGGELLGWTLATDAVIFGYRLEPDDTTYRIASVDLTTGDRSELFSISSRLSFELDVDPIDGRILFDRTDALDSDIVALVGAR
jgi:Tol biopolymer transport system component/DNA-binding winged helix-turn-helix (wHTH) protein